MKMMEKQEEMVDVEEAVREYLAEYGNTKETDLLSYIKGKYDYSDKGAKKVVARMEKKKKIFRLVHGKLKPPAVYFSVRQHVPLELRKELIRANARIQASENQAYGEMFAAAQKP